MAKRITDQQGQAALSEESFDEAIAVRYLLQQIADNHPGRSVELRVPPYGAIQCIEGLNHRRGTPPNVVEISASTFVSLAVGKTTWHGEIDKGTLIASGDKASELGKVFPLSGYEL